MRILVCSDSVGALSSVEAGRALADGWAAHSVTVVPAGEAGGGLLDALAATTSTDLESDAVAGRLTSVLDAPGLVAVAVPGPGVASGPIPSGASSLPLGLGLRRALELEPRDRDVVVDLVGDDVHDGGAGILAALGATADVTLDRGVGGLRDLSHLDLAAARELVGGRTLIGVVPDAARDDLLRGLRGITSRRGRAHEQDPADLLATDDSLGRLAELAGVPDGPGVGACGGAGLAVLALGGRLATGPALTLDRVRPPVDLVVTGCSVLDAVGRGGGVVRTAAAAAERFLAPCIVFAGEVLVGGRELRTLGIENAYPLHSSTRDQPTGGEVSASALSALAVRVARGWQW